VTGQPAAHSQRPSAVARTQQWTTVLDGARLRQLRRQHGLSAAQLAGKAGIGRSTVIRLERQPRCSCRTRTLARLAAALGQSPAALTPSQSLPGHAAR
jgi:transcriptional regulator with XRE-family HTH domain